MYRATGCLVWGQIGPQVHPSSVAFLLDQNLCPLEAVSCLICTSSRSLEPGHRCLEQWHPSCDGERKGQKAPETASHQGGPLWVKNQMSFVFAFNYDYFSHGK